MTEDGSGSKNLRGSLVIDNSTVLTNRNRAPVSRPAPCWHIVDCSPERAESAFRRAISSFKEGTMEDKKTKAAVEGEVVEADAEASRGESVRTELERDGQGDSDTS